VDPAGQGGGGAGEPARDAASAGIDAIGREDLGEEVAEVDQLAVGKEVDLAVGTALGGEQDTLDDSRNMG